MEKTIFTIFLFAGLCAVNSFLKKEHFYVETPNSWVGSQAYCRENYNDLSSVLTQDDMDRILHAAGNHNKTSAWIGLTRSSYSGSSWKWSDVQTLNFEKWATGQPDNTYSDESYYFSFSSIKYYKYNCAYVHEGYWYNANCMLQLPFFCFREYDRNMVLVQEKMTWAESLDYCRNTYTDLVSLASLSAVQQVSHYIDGAQTDFVWTGLRFLAGQWLWVNRDPLEFEGWVDANSYQCPALPQRCGALSVTDTVWEAKPCEDKLNFICYMQLASP